MPNLPYKNAAFHYSDQGNGPVLVLLHGFLEDLSMWDDLVDSFKKTHRVICLDLLGHGKTENLGYIHTMEMQAQLLHFLLVHLNVSQCIIIGHSMGGYIALAFAELFPEMVQGICLMNSTALADTEEKKHNRDRGIKAVKQNHKIFIRIAIPNLFSEENRSVFTTEINNITETALKMGVQGIIASLEGMKVRKDLSHLLDKKEFDTMMIIGRKDPALDHQSLMDQVEKYALDHVIFDDGHMSHVENRSALKLALNNWHPILKSVSP